MKTAIGLAAAFVGVLALIARSADPASAGAEARPRGAVATAPRIAPETPVRLPSAIEAPSSRTTPSASPSSLPMQGAAQAPTAGVLTARLDGELGLSAPQRGRIEEIFRARELEVGAIQERVLLSGYFNPRETDPRLAELREASYVQISMVLDAEQNRRFAEVLRRNLINDHMVIALPDSLVLLD